MKTVIITATFHKTDEKIDIPRACHECKHDTANENRGWFPSAVNYNQSLRLKYQ